MIEIEILCTLPIATEVMDFFGREPTDDANNKKSM